MARHRVTRLSFLSALTLSTVLQVSSVPLALAQTPQTDGAGTTAQQKEKTPPPASNPVADAIKERDRDALKAVQKRGPLPNYVDGNDVSTMREQNVDADLLPLFGYNVFEPARMAIRARRAALARLTGERMTPPDQLDDSGRPKKAQRKPYTREELAAVEQLTNAQKLDIFLRYRDNKLSDDDVKKYRALLESRNGLNPEAQRDPSEDLTPEEKLDLLERQRDGRLTSEERRKYRTFLAPQKEEKPKEPSAADLLSTQEKLDLLQRQRDGKLTDDERVKYKDFLTPQTQDQNGPGAGAGTFAGVGAGAPGGDAGPIDRSDPRFRAGMQSRRDSGFDDQDAVDQYGPGYYPRRPRTSSTGDYSDGGTLDQYPDTFASTRPSGRYFLPDEREQITSRLQMPAVDAYSTVSDPWTMIYANGLASAPATYQISGGDRITLRYWSPTMEVRERRLEVDPRGYVTIPDVGPVNVAGQTAAGAERVIGARLHNLFRNVQTSVELQQLRTMPITVAGDAFSAGTYQVPAVASAIDLVIAAGGPTDAGSLRRIQVHRRGSLVGTIDFYRFLITGDRSADIPLQPGDVIYIPGHEARVALRGEVRHPAVYELLPGETVADALRYAGDVKPSGVSQRVQVTTLQPGKARVIKDIDATNGAAKQVAVYDGDAIDVLSVRQTIANKVSIEGAVDQPSEYALTDGMTVRDLLMLARGPLPDAYPTVAHLYRVNADNTTSLIQVNLEKALAGDPAANFKLTRWDRLKVFSRHDFIAMGRRQVTVMGAVKHEGVYSFSDGMRVNDLLLDAGGASPEAYTDEAYVMHSRPDGSYAYDYVNLNAAMKGDDKQNIRLAERDTLFIFRTEQARFTPEHRVSVQGEVQVQGEYPRGDGMHLSDALRLAGGLTPRAGDRIQIAHARTALNEPPVAATYSAGTASVSPDPQLQDGDVITIQGRGDYRDKPAVVRVEGAVNMPGPIVLDGPRMRLSDIVAKAGGLRPEAFPQGAEFRRNPDLLATDVQKRNAEVINRVNDILNQAEYKRALALSDIERIKAVGKAVSSNTPLAIPGITGTPDTSGANAVAQTGATALFQHDLVSLPRSLTPLDMQPGGNVAVNLGSALQKPGGDDDILMMDGDTITVPEMPTTVQVIGAVMKSTAVQYNRGFNLRDYVTAAGGYAPDAASEERVLVIHMGGGLAPAKKVRSIEPGDVILVPPKVMAEKLSSRGNDIDSVFKGLTGTALIVLVAKKLFGL